MKKNFIVMCCALLCSCNSYRDKSVFETIPESEMLSKAKDDVLFLEVYDIVNGVRGKMGKLSSVEKSRYYEITYSDLMKIKKSLSDSKYDSYNRQWEKEFGGDEQELHRISKYYRDMVDDIDARQFSRASFFVKHGRFPSTDQEFWGEIVPEVLIDYWGSFGYLYKDKAIQQLVNENYMSVGNYIVSKEAPLEYEFLKLLNLI